MSRESPSTDELFGVGAEAGEAEAFYAEDHPILYRLLLVRRWFARRVRFPMFGKILCAFGLHRWLHVFEHCRCDHYRCDRCDKYRTVHY